MNKFISYLKDSILAPIKGSFDRFKEIFVELLILAIVLVYNNRAQRFDYDYLRFINALTISLFVLVIYHTSFILAYEKFKLKLSARILGGVGVGLLAVLFGLYYYLNYQGGFNFFLSFSTTAIIVTGIVLFVSVPYFYKRANYTIYLPYLLTRFLISVFYSAALILGTIGVIGLMDFLFELSINTRLYTDIAIIFGTLVGGPLFLGYVPSINKNLNIKDFGIVWKVLIVRIVIPLASIATLIIFAYATLGRLIGVYDGNIFLVSAFSSLAVVLVSFVLSDVFESEINYVNWFRKYIPYPMLLLVLNLGIELIIEVLNQGMNVNNYITGLFTDFFAISYLIILLKRYYQPILIPMLLSGSLLVASFTPIAGLKDWSYSATLNQLQSTLTQLNMLSNNQIVKRSDLSQAEINKINEILGELSSYHGFDNIEFLPANFELSLTKNVFGFDYYYFDQQASYLSFGASLNQGYDISGYDRSYQVFISIQQPSSAGTLEASLNNNSVELKVSNSVIASLDLTAKMNDIYNRYGTSKFEVPASEVELLFSDPKYKMVITQLGARIEADGSYRLESLNFILLVNE